VWTKRIVAGGAILLAAALIALLLHGPAAPDAVVPQNLSRAADGPADLPSFQSDVPPPVEVPAARAEALSAPLVPGRASLTVRLPREVQAADPVPVGLAATDGSWSATGEVRAAASWMDLTPGDYLLAVHAPGWSAPQPRLALGSFETVEVQLVPTNRLQGVVVEARSRRAVEDVRLVVDVSLRQPEGFKATRSLFGGQVHLPDGAFDLAGFDLTNVDTVRVSAEVAHAEPASSGWLPIPTGPFWSGLVLELPDAAVRGRVTAAEHPHVELPFANVALVPSDVTPRDVRFGDGEMLLAPAALGAGARPPLAQVIADEHGAYALRHALPGQARLLAWLSGRVPTLSAPFELPSGPGAVDVDLELPLGGTIRVVVHMPLVAPAEGGEALPREVAIRIALEPLDLSGAGQVSSRAEACDGDAPGEGTNGASFAGLAAGDYLVSALLVSPVVSGSGRLIRKQVRLAGSEELQVDLRSDSEGPGFRVTGRVVLPRGLEIAESSLTLVRRGAPIDGATVPQAMGNLLADGSFELRDLLPGDYLLAVTANDSARGRKALGFVPVSLDASPPGELLIKLTTPHVRVLAAPELRGKSLVLSGDTELQEADAILDLAHIAIVVPVAAGGEAHLYGMPPGRYGLAPRDEPERSTAFDVVRGSGEVQVDVR